MAHENNRLQKRMKHLEDRLKLSQTQTASVKAVLTDHHTRAEALRQAHKQSDEDHDLFHSERQALHQTTNHTMKTILTEEQFTLYLKMETRRRHRRKTMKALGLTPEQKASWKAIHKETRDKRDGILEAAQDRAKAKPLLKELRHHKQLKLLALLNPEQSKQFLELQAKQKDHGPTP